jgi:hypothetical protein
MPQRKEIVAQRKSLRKDEIAKYDGDDLQKIKWHDSRLHALSINL